MFMKRMIISAVAVALGVMLGVSVAFATDAKATTWVNVRAGPGTNFAAVDTMAPGEVGNMTQCQGSWCYIERSGTDGWVSSNYLTGVEATPSDPDCGFQLTIGPSGPQFSIVCGDTGSVTLPVPVPTPTPASDRVCFFKDANYAGASFCREAGTYNHMPAGFDNNVTSVALHGNAKARVCEFADLGPGCHIVSSSESHLGVYMDNDTSSFQIVNGPPAPMKQVCLFDHPNYTGDHVCFKVGTHTLPPAAQNQASSVLLLEGAQARLSKSPVYGIGGAYPVSTSKLALPASWNNQTRSVRVD